MSPTDIPTAEAMDLQVMWNRLIAIVEEQAQALMRTAFSTIVRESGDLSAGIFDREGRMLAQAVTGTPGHVNTMMESVLHFLDRFPVGTMKSGDVFVTNDPWKGTGHLFDFVVVTPCFHHGEMVGLFACTSHVLDVGGIGFLPDASDVFQEGLRIPIGYLMREGAMDARLMELILANSRDPFGVEGDIHSLITSNETGARALCVMLDEFGREGLDRVDDYILAQSEKAMRAAIAEMPAGRWDYHIRMDGYDHPIDLRATLVSDGSSIHVDLAGSSPQVGRGINVPLCYATAYAVYGLACVFGPEIPNNSGSLAPFTVTAPPGCILNAQDPAPVTSRHLVGQMMPDLVLGCLRQAIPDRVPAESTSCVWHMVFRGKVSDEASPGMAIVTASGGMGARPGLDGLTATGFPSGVSTTPIEIVEQGGAILVERKELRVGSGGAGASRGGDGLSIAVSSATGRPIDLLAIFDRIRNPPRGVFGGADGAPGSIALSSGRPIGAKGIQRIEPGETLLIETPGGGGLGTPV